MKLDVPKWAISSKGKGIKMRIKSIGIVILPLFAELIGFKPMTEDDAGFLIQLAFIVIGAGLHIWGWIRAEMNEKPLNE